ncbi:hypothetical protein ABZ477_06570 [Microbacterium sp. NPDC019599]|uniref:hypothetical protein n=1 Tax=Microbacterium sp. NPDC019599 TaxID=3154690 RepID=UPI0033E20089
MRTRRVDVVADHDAPGSQDRALQQRVARSARAFSTVIPAHAFYAGTTAVALHGLPLEQAIDRLCVAVHSPARALRGSGVRGIKVSPALASVRDLNGLRVASPASTWAMLADELTVRQLVILGDAIVRVPRDAHGRPRPEAQLATIEQLRAAMEAPRRRGRRALEAALEDVRVGSMSPLETDFRLVSTRGGLPEPRLDVEIRDDAGRLLGISDAVYVDERVIAEVEGDHHRMSKAQWDRDIAKYAAYTAQGWEVVRLTSRHIRGPRPEAVQIVREALTRRGWRGLR